MLSAAALTLVGGAIGEYRRYSELPADDGTGIEVVLAGAFRHVVEWHVALGVARKDQRLACVEQRLKFDNVRASQGTSARELR